MDAGAMKTRLRTEAHNEIEVVKMIMVIFITINYDLLFYLSHLSDKRWIKEV